MRIGDLADAVGVSTRTVRHYHQVGVLPEPERTLGGYRDYSFDDLIRLLHVRRLVELGLGLSEIGEVLESGAGADLSAVLDALEEDLAEQERVLTERRAQLTALRAHWEGRIDISDLGSRTIADFRRAASAVGATGPTFELDHQVMALLPDAATAKWVEPVIERMKDPAEAERIVAAYSLFDSLSGEVDDEVLAELLDLVRDLWPPEVLEQLRGLAPTDFLSTPVLDAALERLTPPQRAVAGQVLAALMKED